MTTLQKSLNYRAMQYVPKITAAMQSTTPSFANQMKAKTLQAMSNSVIAISLMNARQLTEFQDDLLEVFAFKEWT
jgi:hypothetical protein